MDAGLPARSDPAVKPRPNHRPAPWRWTCHRLHRSLGPWRPAWDALVQRRFGDHPLLHSEFVERLLQRFGEGREMLAVRTAGGGEPEAMCILVQHRPGLWRSFLPSQAQISPTLIRCVDELEDLHPALPGFAWQIDLMCLDPRYSELVNGRPPTLEVTKHAVTIGQALCGHYDDWWERRPKQLRNNLRRYEKRAAAEAGNLRFVVIDRPEAIGAAVRRYAQLEGAGWKGQAGTALNGSVDQLGFYQDLMERHAQAGSALAFELHAGARLAASRLAIVRGTMIVMLKTTFDETMRVWAPGRVLLGHVMAHLFAHYPNQRVEFYTDASADQLQWADELRCIQHVTVYRNAGTALAGRAVRALRHRWRPRPGDESKREGLPLAVGLLEPDQTPDSEMAALWSRASRRHFQLDPDWWRLYAKTVMQGSRGTRLFVARRGSRPQAVLPINLDPALERLGGMVGALSNYYTALYEPLLAADATAAELEPLLHAVRAEVAPGASLRFQPMDPSSPTLALLEGALARAGYASFRFPLAGNWILPVRQSWEEYFASRPGPLRSTIQRMGRRLGAEGGHIELVTGSEGLERALQAFQDVYGRSWKPREPVDRFIPELVALCARRGWLRLATAWVGERPIAAQLWIVHDERAFIFKLAYDDEFRRMAPGTLLTAFLMKHVIETDRVREVDFLIGDEPYKQQWMTERRERVGLVAHDLRHGKGWPRSLRERVAQTWHRLRQWSWMRLGRIPGSTNAAN